MKSGFFTLLLACATCSATVLRHGKFPSSSKQIHNSLPENVNYSQLKVNMPSKSSKSLTAKSNWNSRKPDSKLKVFAIDKDEHFPDFFDGLEVLLDNVQIFGNGAKTLQNVHSEEDVVAETELLEFIPNAKFLLESLKNDQVLTLRNIRSIMRYTEIIIDKVKLVQGRLIDEKLITSSNVLVIEIMRLYDELKVFADEFELSSGKDQWRLSFTTHELMQFYFRKLDRNFNDLESSITKSKQVSVQENLPIVFANRSVLNKIQKLVEKGSQIAFVLQTNPYTKSQKKFEKLLVLLKNSLNDLSEISRRGCVDFVSAEIKNEIVKAAELEENLLTDLNNDEDLNIVAEVLQIIHTQANNVIGVLEKSSVKNADSHKVACLFLLFGKHWN